MSEEGASECWECKAGYFCPAKTIDYTSNPCPVGHYCPNGTEYSNQFKCPRGTFRNQTLGESEDDCFPCPPGQYCDKDGQENPAGQCDAGYFCILGAKSRTPRDFDNYTSGDCLCPKDVTGKVWHYTLKPHFYFQLLLVADMIFILDKKSSLIDF